MNQMPPHPSYISHIKRPGKQYRNPAQQHWNLELRREREEDGSGVGEEFKEVLEGGFEGGEGAAVGGLDSLLIG